MEPGKKHPLAAVAVVLAVCLTALAVAGVVTYARGQSAPVMTCGDFALSNTELSYYYWSEYFYFTESCGDYLDGVVDLSKPLDEQAYSQDQSWQAYLLEEALSVARDTMVMVFRANETGFVMPRDYQDAYEAVLDSFASAAEANGKSLLSYLQDSYGRDATVESFEAYLYNAHLAAAFSDALLDAIDPTESEVQAYYESHSAEETLEQAREDLRLETYQNEFLTIRSSYTFLVNYDRIEITPPKGLYENA